MTDTKKVYETLVPGVVRARPEDSGLGKHDNYLVRFKITGTPPGDQAKNMGKHITWFGGFKGEGMKWTTKALKTLGWDGAQDLADFKAPTDKEYDVNIEIATLEAKGDLPARKVDRVAWFNSLDGTGGSGLEKIKLSPAEAKAASQVLMERVRAFEAGTTDGAASKVAENPFKPDPKDQIPF